MRLLRGLSVDCLDEVQGLKHKNVATKLLEKLLKDETKTRSKRNVVQSRAFFERLKDTMNAYHNRAIGTHEIIEELIQLAKTMREASHRGEDLELNDDELAFYDAIAQRFLSEVTSNNTRSTEYFRSSRGFSADSRSDGN